jgi:hypothetical protein
VLAAARARTLLIAPYRLFSFAAVRGNLLVAAGGGAGGPFLLSRSPTATPEKLSELVPGIG